MSSPAVKELRRPGQSLKRRLLSSSAWVVGGEGAIQMLRLVSTLVMSRLLAPETFGVMAIVTSTLAALSLFAEVGIQGSIIHDERGADQNFLDTAWTVQIGRGLTIAGTLCALAIPIADFYGESQLRTLLPAISVNAILAGTASTALLTLTRQMKPEKPIIWRVLAKVISLVVMLACAWKWRSIWALVIGSVVEQFIISASSHRLIPGYRNHIHMDRDIVRSLARFGRWVWVSTIATWLLGQGDKLILGKLLTAKELGIYSIASLLSAASVAAIESLARGVLQPFYAALLREDPNALKRQTLKVRGALMLVVLPISWSLVFLGGWVVDLLYDARYAEAGWMLRLLAVGAVATNIIRSSERLLLADGDSFQHMIVRVTGGVMFLASIAVASQVGGLQALIIGIVASRYLAYIPLAVALHRRGVWLPQLDLPALVLTALVALFSQWLLPT